MNKRIRTFFDSTVLNSFITLCSLLFAHYSLFPVAAQSSAAYYWQYAAAAQLEHIHPLDVDGDDVDELLLIDANGTAELIDANGRSLWEYTAPAPVRAVTTIQTDGRPAIILATASDLLLLDIDGNLKWRRAIASFAPPLSRITGASTSDQERWLAEQALRPVAVIPLPVLSSSYTDYAKNEQIVLLLESGEMQLYDSEGIRQWAYKKESFNTADVTPLIAAGDIDGDGRSEIVRTLFNPDRRFSQMELFDADGTPVWEKAQPLSGHITTLTLLTDNTPARIAVGSDRGDFYLYNGEQKRLWTRSLNPPITHIVAAPFGLIVGADEGVYAAYDEDGTQLWHNFIEDGGTLMRLDTLPVLPTAGQPLFSLLLSKGDGNLADGVLLDANGRILKTAPDLDTTSLSRLLDINHDGIPELLSAQFATLTLLSGSVGSNDIVQEWSYPLLSAPSCMLTIDFDGDGVDDLLTGGQDGRLHRINPNGSPRWIVEPGGKISHLLPYARPNDEQLAIIVARNSPETSGIEMRLANGDLLWKQEFEAEITAVITQNINRTLADEIIIGLDNGTVAALSTNGVRLSEQQIGQSVTHLLPLPDSENSLIAAGKNTLFEIPADDAPTKLLSMDAPIIGLYALPKIEAASMLLLTADKQIWVLNRRGTPLSGWPISLNEAVLHTEGEGGNRAFLLAGEAVLTRLNVLDGKPHLAWGMPIAEEMTALYWGDVDSDGTADIALGDKDGFVYLYDQERRLTNQVELSSAIFGLGNLRHSQERPFGLTAVTQNGLAQTFRTQENWPPLLTSPKTAVNEKGDQYSFSISVNDVENDEIRLELEIQNPVTKEWIGQGEMLLNGGGNNLQWNIVSPPNSSANIPYRFTYADPFHAGVLTPPPAPFVVPSPSSRIEWIMGGLILFTFALILSIILFIRWSQQSVDARARRFYRQIDRNEANTLHAFEQLYGHISETPDLLLNIATLARQRRNVAVTALADGLFLLADRPLNALPLLQQALACDHTRNWLGQGRWVQTTAISTPCLTASSITALSLLRPRLLQLAEQPYTKQFVADLLPILTHLRDSERVESVNDQLLYLNEAAALLNGLQGTLPAQKVTMERPLLITIVERWHAIVTAAIEEIKGQARLRVVLKTGRIAPSEYIDLLIEIKNEGRAAAKNLFATLDKNPAYSVVSSPQIIPLLPSGHGRLLTFTLTLHETDRFRLTVTVNYDDHHHHNKQIQFGDMVHLLPPQRPFQPIPNPYSPGAPLRSNSPLFFGREELFSFIADNAGQMARRNVMILVGQRRTGKTSLLLRLEQNLPDTLIPVYIDCQSLGITAGMPALLHELAWQISDTLSLYDMSVDVAPLEEWGEDANGRFQRQFLPRIRQALPAASTLLLVFDEFEAFENLVNDGILPPTFFTYLRHLMQHSKQLSFIFVGTRRLEEMTAAYWSVLFNIALYRKIGYLNDKAAVRVITEPVRPHIIYDDLALDKILRVTSGHPYFLQLVCYALIKRANEQKNGYVTISDVNGALTEMMQLGGVHFAYLWQRSTGMERMILTAVSHLMESERPFHPEKMIEKLAVYGRSPSLPDLKAALDHLVQRDIMAETMIGATTAYQLRIGLVGLWVEQTKSLSKLIDGE